MRINLLAPVAINKSLFDLVRRGNGSIVHIGSIHSQLTKHDFSAYAASKAALASLTRSMAIELGSEVRVNAIDPAAILTPMLQSGFADDEASFSRLASLHPAFYWST